VPSNSTGALLMAGVAVSMNGWIAAAARVWCGKDWTRASFEMGLMGAVSASEEGLVGVGVCVSDVIAVKEGRDKNKQKNCEEMKNRTDVVECFGSLQST
jgi:hypothetical protein